MSDRLTRIHLQGDLSQFGDYHDLLVASPREAVHALCVMKKGFKECLRGEDKVYSLQIVNGDDIRAMSLVELDSGIGENDLVLSPVISGAGNNTLNIVIGVALIAGAIYFAPAAGVIATTGGSIGAGTAGAAVGGLSAGIAGSVVTYGNVALLGIGLVLSGVGGLLAPTPESPNTQSPDNQASFLFNGARNVADEGVPIPIAFGRVYSGSIVVAAGVTTDEYVEGQSHFDVKESMATQNMLKSRLESGGKIVIAKKSDTEAYLEARRIADLPPVEAPTPKLSNGSTDRQTRNNRGSTGGGRG